MVEQPGRALTHNYRKRHSQAFVLGSVIGGFSTGIILGIFALAIPGGGLAIPAPTATITGTLVITAALVADDLGVIKPIFPRYRRQARQSLAGYTRTVSSATFGFELGTGFRTATSGLGVYVAIGFILLVGPPGWIAVAMGGIFGFVRGLVLIDRTLSHDSGKWDTNVKAMRLPLAAAGTGVAGVLTACCAAVVGMS